MPRTLSVAWVNRWDEVPAADVDWWGASHLAHPQAMGAQAEEIRSLSSRVEDLEGVVKRERRRGDLYLEQLEHLMRLQQQQHHKKVGCMHASPQLPMTLHVTMHFHVL